jgi:hypothetical protein
MTLQLFDPDKPSAELVSQFGPNAWLVNSALVEFECWPMPAFWSNRLPIPRAVRKREEKRQTVEKYSGQFLKLMASETPPVSEEQAVKALVTIGTWLASWIIRKLAVQVIRFCWRKWQEAITPAEGSAV